MRLFLGKCLAKGCEIWARSWMRFAGIPGVGRLAMSLASWWYPPYRGRVILAGMHRRGYIAPSATLHHTALRLGEHMFIGDRVLIYQADQDSGPVDIGTRIRLSREVIIETGTGGGLTIGDETSVHPRCQFSAYQGSIELGVECQLPHTVPFILTTTGWPLTCLFAGNLCALAAILLSRTKSGWDMGLSCWMVCGLAMGR
jgi:hypothetical protein